MKPNDTESTNIHISDAQPSTTEHANNTDSHADVVESAGAQEFPVGAPKQEPMPAEITDAENAQKKSESPAVRHEDNLELHNLKFRERQRAKRRKLQENMEGMSKGQKIGYILSYYKGRFLAAAIILAICIALPVTIYKRSRPVAIAYCIVNAADTEAVDTSFVDDYLDYYDLHGSYQIKSDVTVHLDKETYLEEYAQNSDSSVYTELPMMCFNGYYDVIIMDEKGLEYCAMQEIIYPLNNYFDADVYDRIEDRIVEAADNSDTVVPFAVDISDTEFAKGLNLGYDKVYIGFPGNTERNYTNAKRMLNYILDLQDAIAETKQPV